MLTMATAGLHPQVITASEARIVCGRCDCEDVRQVCPQGLWERWVLPRFSTYPFLCGCCGTRFLARWREDPRDDD